MSSTLTAGDAGTTSAQHQYLTFLLASEEYGLEILKVQEIRGYTAVTPIPHAPPHIKGVMNLRGAVVPVVDLRARFGMPATEYGKFTVIIVVRLGERVAGLVVDAVSDVLQVAASEIEAPPDLGVGVDTHYMTGLAKVGDRLVLLLDILEVIGAEAGSLEAVAAA